MAEPTFLSGDELRFPIAPLLALLIGTQIALVFLFAGLDGSQTRSVWSVTPVIALVAIPALMLVATIPILKKHPRSIMPLALVFAAGLAMRFSHLGADPILETDHYRYLWDGALLAHGINPYAISPRAALGSTGGGIVADLAMARIDIVSRINFPELRTIYPGTAQLSFGLAHLMAPWKVDGLRAVLFAAELCTFWLIVSWLRQLGRSTLLVSLYWLNPLIVLCFANQVHIDVLIPPLLLGALLLIQKNQAHALAGALLGLAAGVKLWPLLMVPLCAGAVWPEKAKAARLAIAFAVTSAVVVAPLVSSSAQQNSGLIAYATQWSNNNAIYAWSVTALHSLGAAPGVTELVLRGLLSATIVLMVIWLALRVSSAAMSLSGAALFVSAMLFYLSPAQFPWYAVWFLPLAILGANSALLFASVTLPSYFLFFPLSLQGEAAFFMHYVSAIHLVPVLLWLLIEWRRGSL